MADDGSRGPQVAPYARAGEILMWAVSSEAAGLDMGAAADALGLGEWSVCRAVDGVWWFDLVCAFAPDPVLLMVTFGRLPERHY